MQDVSELLHGTKNKVLMTVFPHPDDETMATGGLLITAKKAGWKTIVVSATAGGAGQIHVHPNGKLLVDLRKRELKKAAKILEVDEVVVGDFDDGKVKYQIEEITSWLHSYIVKYKPGVVVTYDPSGFYGHPDHIAISQVVCQLQSVENLLFVSVPKEYRGRFKLRGMNEVKENMVDPTHKLDLGWDWINKWRAARAHRSQKLGKNLPIPLWLFMALYHFEYYHLVEKKRKYVYKYIDYEII